MSKSTPTEKNASLGRKLLRYIFGFYFIVTLTVTLVQIFSEYHHAKSIIIMDLMKYRSTFSESISEAIWQYNMEQLHSILEGLSKVEIIKGAKITNTDNKIIASIGVFPPEGADEGGTKIEEFEGVREISTLDNSANVSPEKTNLIQYTFDVTFKDKAAAPQIVGKAYFYSSQGVVINRVKYSVIVLIVNSIIKTLALWLIFLICIKMLVENPLNSLTRAIRSMDPDKPEKNKHFDNLEKVSKNQDQIGELTRSFIGLTENIISHVSTIKILNQDLEDKIAERTEELKQKSKDLAAMFENLELGVMMLKEGGKIDNQYSEHLRAILEEPAPEKYSIKELLLDRTPLTADDKAQIMAAIDNSVGGMIFSFAVNRHLFPQTLLMKSGKKEKILDIDWTPIANADEQIERIMITLKDVTEIRNMRLSVETSKQEGVIAQQLLETTLSQAKDFFASTRILFSDVLTIFKKYKDQKQEIRKEDANQMFLLLHTIKGNARLRKYSYLVNEIHLTEQYFEDIRKGLKKWNYEEANKLIEGTKDWLFKYEIILNERILKFIGTSSKDMEKTLKDIRNVIYSSSTQSNDEKIAAIESICKIMQQSKNTIESIALDVLQNSSDLCAGYEIQMPTLAFKGNDLNLNESGTHLLQNVLSHCITNSIVHGFERGQERQDSGKSPSPNISVLVQKNKGVVNISYSDDGRGLNMGALIEKGKKAGILQNNYKDSEIADLIFHNGITTADKLTEAAGRGIGMEAVRQITHAVGGKMNLRLKRAKPEDNFVPISIEFSIPAKELENEKL